LQVRAWVCVWVPACTHLYTSGHNAVLSMRNMRRTLLACTFSKRLGDPWSWLELSGLTDWCAPSPESFRGCVSLSLLMIKHSLYHRAQIVWTECVLSSTGGFLVLIGGVLSSQALRRLLLQKCANGGHTRETRRSFSRQTKRCCRTQRTDAACMLTILCHFPAGTMNHVTD